jgi:hypothetical protein
LELLLRNQPLNGALSHLNGSAAALVTHQVPDAASGGADEQMGLSGAVEWSSDPQVVLHSQPPSRIVD